MTRKMEETIYNLAKITGFNLDEAIRLLTAVLYMWEKIEIYNQSYSGILELALACIELDNISLLNKILSCKQKRRYINYILENLLEYSIEHEKHEITAMLIDYKYKNNLFTEKKWKL